MIIGTAETVEPPMLPERERDVLEFGSAWGLIRWTYGVGAACVAQCIALDPAKVGTGTRDASVLDARQLRYALAVRCVDAARRVPCGDDEVRDDLPILAASAGGGLSDARIARMLGCSEWQVRRRRNAAVAAVCETAMRLGLLPEGAR